MSIILKVVGIVPNSWGINHIHGEATLWHKSLEKRIKGWQRTYHSNHLYAKSSNSSDYIPLLSIMTLHDI